MQAEILSIGTELLLGEITDTNAQFISSRLRDIGVNVYRRITVGDNPGRLVSAFEDSIQRADLVIATGGLGPTGDDVTAGCLAAALGRGLSFNDDAWRCMQEMHMGRNWSSGGSDKKQAYIIDGGFFIPNRVGTAPGQGVIVGGKIILLLPGPPNEMKPMFEERIIPLIKKEFPDLAPIFYVNLNVAGLGEAKTAEALEGLLDCPNPTVAPYAGAGQVRLRIAASASNEKKALTMISQVETKVRERLGHHVYGRNDETLELVIGRLMGKKGLTVAIAESVTGGLICHRLTEVPGASQYFKMGMVSYNPKVKTSSLGLSPEIVYKNESVNEEVAVSMAKSIRLLAGTDLGLATTGFAGPSGGTPTEPLGTVYIGLSHKKEGVFTDRIVYPSSRSRTKAYAAQRALYVLYRFLVQH